MTLGKFLQLFALIGLIAALGILAVVGLHESLVWFQLGALVCFLFGMWQRKREHSRAAKAIADRYRPTRMTDGLVRREFNAFSLSSELDLLLRAIGEEDPPIEFIRAAVTNIHEHLAGGGQLPIPWVSARGLGSANNWEAERTRLIMGEFEEESERPRPPNGDEADALAEWAGEDPDDYLDELTKEDWQLVQDWGVIVLSQLAVAGLLKTETPEQAIKMLLDPKPPPEPPPLDAEGIPTAWDRLNDE